jgi:hypothetical protein
MTWKVVDDTSVLRSLKTAKQTCVRYVMLDPDEGNGPSLEEFARLAESGLLGVMGGSFAQRYALTAYGTDPATVVVTDDTSNEVVAVYVWTGDGGRITTGRDIRLVQLADALSADFDGRARPTNWENPAYTCPECGGSHNGAHDGAVEIADVQVDDDVRLAAETLSFEKWLMMIGMHATDAQLNMMKQLFELGCMPGPLNALRREGGPDVELFVVTMLGQYGEVFDIHPNGSVEADF